MNKIVVITGPTASGKSAISVDIAKKLDGEIISCDSMQIYKRMNIGTAKISQAEMRGIPHHMIDIVEPQESFSVGEYAILANKVIGEVLSRGKVPIIVGGTGLYIDAILYKMSFGGNKRDDVRKSLEDECSKYGKEYMYNMLVQIDPVDAEKIHPNNIKRVLRALEIYRISGKCKSDLAAFEREIQYDCCMAVMNPDRENLYEKINLRVDRMIDQGLLNEINNLLAEGVTFDCQSMQAIGYKEVNEYIDRKLNLFELKEKIKQHSRNYAKRQITWIKKYEFAKWFNPQTQLDSIEDYIVNYIRG